MQPRPSSLPGVGESGRERHGRVPQSAARGTEGETGQRRGASRNVTCAVSPHLTGQAQGRRGGYRLDVNDTLLIGLISSLALLVVIGVVVWSTVTLGGRPSAEINTGRGRSGDAAGSSDGPDERPLVAIVVNPTKFNDLDRVMYQVDSLAEAHGWATRWRETTVEDPGTGQTKEAVAAGADLVCALGGDGTVRSVAAGLLGSDVPMGLLPGGTGNLLARNLDLPIDSLEEAFIVALTGTGRPIDVGQMIVAPHDTQEDAKDYYFLVMAGLGFDASVMADAPEKLKSHIGWAAYVVSGVKQLNGPRFEVSIRADERRPFRRRVRSIIVGNVGKLQGGVELMPDALADDGSLDVVLIAPKGLVGWAAVTIRILTKTRKGHKRVQHLQCRTMQIDIPKGNEEQLQLDGDPIGPARSLTASVLPGALTVRIKTDTSTTGTDEISRRPQPVVPDGGRH